MSRAVMTLGEYVSLQYLAERTGTDVKFWRKQISLGKLPGAVKIGNRIRVPLEDAIAIMQPVTVGG